jgi:hypothetical protein
LTGKKTPFAAFWTGATIRSALAQRGITLPAGVEPELRCGGCRSDVLFVNCRDCALRDCAVERGLARCGECADYPCPKYVAWEKGASVLPHLTACRANVAAARQGGVERWLAAQEERWSCPGCGARFAWYSEACFGCGADLRARAHRLPGWKRLLLRLYFRLARPKA